MDAGADNCSRGPGSLGLCSNKSGETAISTFSTVLVQAKKFGVEQSTFAFTLTSMVKKVHDAPLQQHIKGAMARFVASAIQSIESTADRS